MSDQGHNNNTITSAGHENQRKPHKRTNDAANAPLVRFPVHIFERAVRHPALIPSHLKPLSSRAPLSNQWPINSTRRPPQHVVVVHSLCQFGFTNGGSLVPAFSSTTRDSALMPLHTMIKARVPCRQPRRQNLPCWVVIGSFFLRMLAGLCFIPMKCRASLSMVVDDIVHRALPGSPIGFVLQVWSFLW